MYGRKCILRFGILIVSIAAFLWLLFSSQAYSSDADTRILKDPNDKKWQLLFSTGSYFTPNPFEDMSLALQRQLSERKSVRLGIGYSHNKFESHYIRYDQGIFDNEFEKDTSSSELSIICCFVNYYNTGGKISPYLGAGPFFAYAGRKHNTPVQDGSDKFTSSGYSIGIRTLLGADYRVKSFLNFHAEYSLDLYYNYRRREATWIYYFPGYIDENKYKRSVKSYAVDNNAVRAGISLVF